MLQLGTPQTAIRRQILAALGDPDLQIDSDLRSIGPFDPCQVLDEPLGDRESASKQGLMSTLEKISRKLIVWALHKIMTQR